MNNKDRTFAGQTFPLRQQIHGYDYDDNGNKIFTIIGEDDVYARIQEADNTSDMRMIKEQILPSLAKGEDAVNKYFYAYGDINEVQDETDFNKPSDETITETEGDSTEDANKPVGENVEEE